MPNSENNENKLPVPAIGSTGFGSVNDCLRLQVVNAHVAEFEHRQRTDVVAADHAKTGFEVVIELVCIQHDVGIGDV